MFKSWQPKTADDWFKNYLSFRHENPIHAPLSDLGLDNENFQDSDPDEAIYYLVQPTGLLYGFPSYLPLSDLSLGMILRQPKVMEIAKLVFTETLLSVLVADMESRELYREDPNKRFFTALQQLVYFFIHSDHGYQAISPEEGIANFPEKLLKNWDQWLNRQLKQNSSYTSLSSRLPNSFTFLEMVVCLGDQRGQANHEFNKPINRQTFFNDAFQVVHAAIQANEDVDKQEEALLEQFMASAAYKKSTKTNLKQLVHEPKKPDEIAFTSHHPWLIKRFYLEIAILFIMSDRQIDENEEAFIKNLGNSMGITHESTDEAILALEVFIAQNPKAFQQITTKNKIKELNGDVQKRAQKAVKDNKAKLHQEIKESQELYQLLIKARTTKLSSVEKEKVRTQLIDILKTIPVFVIIGLPGTFMTLPFLISLLPSQFFPTAFQNIKNDATEEDDSKRG